MLPYIKKLYLKKKFDIKKYYLIEKYTRMLIYFIGFPIYLFVLPTLFTIYVLRPFVLIRWSDLNEGRMGSFAAYGDLYICEKNNGINVPKQKYFDIFYFRGKVCNEQLAIMWKRKLNVFPAFFIEKISNLNKFLRNIFYLNNKIHEIEISYKLRDVHLFWESTPPALSFTQEEITRGKKILSEFGLKNNDKFICIFARDSGYLDQHHIPPPAKRTWDYQNFRDYDINNFTLAAEEIVKRGYYVFRIGKFSNKRLNSTNPKIVDYVFSNLKSDFMDIYLAANCSFFLSSSAGIDFLAAIFRKPLASLMIPIGYIQTSRFNVISILKNHVDKKTKKKLSLTEIFSKKLSLANTADHFSRQNVELVENTPEEIKDLAIEMLDLIEDKKKYQDIDKRNQKIFWDLYRKNLSIYENNKNHGKELRGGIGMEFLKQNGNYLT